MSRNRNDRNRTKSAVVKFHQWRNMYAIRKRLEEYANDLSRLFDGIKKIGDDIVYAHEAAEYLVSVDLSHIWKDDGKAPASRGEPGMRGHQENEAASQGGPPEFRKRIHRVKEQLEVFATDLDLLIDQIGTIDEACLRVQKWANCMLAEDPGKAWNKLKMEEQEENESSDDLQRLFDDENEI